MLLKMTTKAFRMNSLRQAFTLIEVLVAMFVLAIGLLGLAGITVVVLRSNTLAQQISQATSITTDLIERIKQVPYGNLLHGTGCGSGVSNAISVCPVIENSGLNAIGVGPNFWPASGSGCRIDLMNPISGSNARWDYVRANLLSRAGPTAFCNVNPERGEFVRYYRIYDSAMDQRVIIAVALWKDRFGKWRHIKLSTTRSP